MSKKERERKRRDAEAYIKRFYFQLRELIRPHSFESLAASSAIAIQASRGVRDQVIRWRPHDLLHAVEVGADVCQGKADKVLLESELQAILDHFRKFEDPCLTHVLTDLDSVGLFLILMDRQQLQQQFAANRMSIGRIIRLLWQQESLAKTDMAIKKVYGVTVEDILTTAISCWAATMATERWPRLTDDYVKQIATDTISAEAFQTCMGFLTYTREQLRARVLDERDVQRSFRALAAVSAFMSRPAIRFDRGWVLPRPALIFPAVQRLVQDLGESVSPEVFHDELGKALEVYAKTVIGEAYGFERLLPGARVKARATGMSCDLIVRFQSCLLLLECKAVQPSDGIVSFESLSAKQSPFRKIVHGQRQLLATAKDLQAGRYADDGFVADLPMYGAVITFGHFCGASMDDIRERVIESQLEECKAPDWPAPLARRPQVWDLEALDYFVVTSVAERVGPLQMIEEKLANAQSRGNDWNRYLNLRVGKRSDPLRDFFRAPFDDLWKARFASMFKLHQDV
jgi:hypothetical protein